MDLLKITLDRQNQIIMNETIKKFETELKEIAKRKEECEHELVQTKEKMTELESKFKDLASNLEKQENSAEVKMDCDDECKNDKSSVVQKTECLNLSTQTSFSAHHDDKFMQTDSVSRKSIGLDVSPNLFMHRN
jgi:hypothetical protein